MVFSNQASKTKVEAIGVSSNEYCPSSVVAILKIVAFLKWTGLLPVATSLSSGFHRIRFARCHITTILWVLTVALQLSMIIAHIIQDTFLKHSADVLANFLFVSSLLCSTVLIPRIGLANKTALESALNTIKEIHGSLSLNFTSSNVWPLPIRVLLLEFLLVIPHYLQVYFYDEEYQITKTPIYTLGTGIHLIGILMHGFCILYLYISSWVVPIQLFIFCRTLANYYLDLANKIRHDLYPDLSCSYQVDILEKSMIHDVGHSQKFRNRLKKLQATSVMLEKAVSDVNTYIGMALLLSLVCHLLFILGNLHYVSNYAFQFPFQNTTDIIILVNVTMMIIQHGTEFLFLIWAADLIPRALNSCKEAVGGIPFCDEDFKDDHLPLDHIQLQSFRSHITAKNVEITAFGLFTISRKIIPPVLGTIITYYLIIAQYAKDHGNGNAAVDGKNSFQ